MQNILLSEIRPNSHQPRQNFDEKALYELANSIKQYGVIEPIILRKIQEKSTFYEIIAGERRFRAAKIIGLEKIPAIICEYNDFTAMQISIIENIQRENLSVIEEALSYYKLKYDYKMLQEDIARTINKSRSHVANVLRLLKLPQKIQEYLQDNKLSMGQAKPLLAIKNEDIQIKLADRIILEKISARQVEMLVKEYLLQSERNKISSQNDGTELFYEDLLNSLYKHLGTKVHIKSNKNKSTLEIEFYSEEDLERIVELLGINNKIKPKKNSSRKFIV